MCASGDAQPQDVVAAPAALGSALTALVPVAPAPAALPQHVSGLWLGQAVPAPSLAESVPVNPILWSLSLLRDASVSAFGCGYFDDAGDLPGSPVLLYTLSGEWASQEGTVTLSKVYTAAPEVTVTYHGRLKREDGAWTLAGSWRNELEGTFGTFACRREED